MDILCSYSDFALGLWAGKFGSLTRPSTGRDVLAVQVTVGFDQISSDAEFVAKSVIFGPSVASRTANSVCQLPFQQILGEPGPNF